MSATPYQLPPVETLVPYSIHLHTKPVFNIEFYRIKFHVFLSNIFLYRIEVSNTIKCKKFFHRTYISSSHGNTECFIDYKKFFIEHILLLHENIRSIESNALLSNIVFPRILLSYGHHSG